MTDDTTDESQQDTRSIEGSGQIDPSLRIDKYYHGSHSVLVLLILAAVVHLSGDYSLVVTGSILALAVCISLLIFPYHVLRDAW